MATIAVVTSSPPFAEGGHLVMARELVRALREEGHQSGLIVTPQNRFGQQGSAYLAAWCTDVELAHEEKKVDQVISLRFPGYAVQHPNHVLWLNHRMREYYDLWDQFSSHLTWKQGIKERARRALIHGVDAHLFKRMRKRYVISATVQARLLMPLMGLMRVALDVQTSRALFARIFEYLDLRPAITDRPDAIDVTAAPCSELSSTRRRLLPSVVPKPGSSGSATRWTYSASSASTRISGSSRSAKVTPLVW